MSAPVVKLPPTTKLSMDRALKAASDAGLVVIALECEGNRVRVITDERALTTGKSKAATAMEAMRGHA